MSDAPISRPERPRGRWRPSTIILIVSLTLNVFFAAAAIGWAVGGPHRGHGGGPGGPLRAYLRDAPEEIRERAREIWTAARPEIRALRQATRDARAARRQAIAAEPFDPAAVAEANTRVRDARRALAERVDADVMTLLEIMPPAERRRLAEALERRGRRRGPPS